MGFSYEALTALTFLNAVVVLAILSWLFWHAIMMLACYDDGGPDILGLLQSCFADAGYGRPHWLGL